MCDPVWIWRSVKPQSERKEEWGSASPKIVVSTQNAFKAKKFHLHISVLVKSLQVIKILVSRFLRKWGIPICAFIYSDCPPNLEQFIIVRNLQNRFTFFYFFLSGADLSLSKCRTRSYSGFTHLSPQRLRAQSKPISDSGSCPLSPVFLIHSAR